MTIETNGLKVFEMTDNPKMPRCVIYSDANGGAEYVLKSQADALADALRYASTLIAWRDPAIEAALAAYQEGE